MTEEEDCDELLCAICYQNKHSPIENSDDYVWIECVACEMCTDQPVVWFKKNV